MLFLINIDTSDEEMKSESDSADFSIPTGTSKAKANKMNDTPREGEQSVRPAIKELAKSAKSVAGIAKKEAKSVTPALQKDAKSVTDALPADVEPVTTVKENGVSGRSNKKEKKLSTKEEDQAVASSSKAAEKYTKKRKADETPEVISPKKSRVAPVKPKDSNSKEAGEKDKDPGRRKSTRAAVRKVRTN